MASPWSFVFRTTQPNFVERLWIYYFFNLRLRGLIRNEVKHSLKNNWAYTDLFFIYVSRPFIETSMASINRLRRHRFLRSVIFTKSIICSRSIFFGFYIQLSTGTTPRGRIRGPECFDNTHIILSTSSTSSHQNIDPWNNKLHRYWSYFQIQNSLQAFIDSKEIKRLSNSRRLIKRSPGPGGEPWIFCFSFIFSTLSSA